MDIWSLNLRHLHAVERIAGLGSVNAAASAVNLSQPAITQALRRLEDMLGLPLFERRHDGMIPTRAGEILSPRIAAALTHVRSPHVTMSRMRAMLAVAETGSYTSASQATGLSVPSIHRAVGDLALALRRALVSRRGKFAITTDAGNQLAREFRLAQVELETGLSEVMALRGHETRRIAIGAMPLSRARILPAAVARFLARRPQVRLTIVEGSRAELVEPLRSGVIDVMVGALREPLTEPDLAQHRLFDDVPAFYARHGHPLAGTSPAGADMARFPFTLAPPGTPLRESFEGYFTDLGLPLPPVPIESGSVMMIRQVLMGTDFIALLSPDQVSVEVEAEWLRPLARLPERFARTIGMTTRASLLPTEVQSEFFADLKAAARECGITQN
ncbi:MULTISPECIES: LysR substrate-binding domain-containing protein [Sphingomonadaceae]|uniref:LysR family transcriptional regulator n=1 Tax=Novosphingobium resinovorum TaxID=158500 RepID=A0A1D8AFF2_9SPHN|nr:MULTISPECIES: LysR substrate-binding domain-containing protein [Sphingomonadaceae]AOR80835.1 LysR family transcriptional regulator [Novosphingobium resinovorum]